MGKEKPDRNKRPEHAPLITHTTRRTVMPPEVKPSGRACRSAIFDQNLGLEEGCKALVVLQDRAHCIAVLGIFGIRCASRHLDSLAYPFHPKSQRSPLSPTLT